MTNPGPAPAQPPLRPGARHQERREERLALRRGNLDLEARELTVRHHLVKDAAGRSGVGQPRSEAGHRKLLRAEDAVVLMGQHRRRERRGMDALTPGCTCRSQCLKEAPAWAQGAVLS